MISPAATAVRVHELTTTRGGRTVLHGVSAMFEVGTVTALMGPNGSGKSTLLEVVAGVLPVTAGHVDGVRPAAVAFVPQRADVSAQLPITVGDTVAMGRWRTRGAWRPFRSADRRVVDSVIDLLDLGALRDRPLAELSGGQRQRALVGQGLASESPLLLLDEPTAGVDAASARTIHAALRAHADRGAVVVHATHEAVAVDVSDAVLHLRAGRVNESIEPAGVT